VPVVIAKAKRGDMPIYLDAPGTVVARNIVTVRTRVDGQILKVHYEEGQSVKEGDLLVEIDPRPFQVQLTQAQGQLARDEASLKNAKLDLTRYQAAGKGATQQQVDTAAAAVAQFEGAVKTDQGQIDSAKLQLVYCQVTAPITGTIGLRLVDAGNIVHASDTTGLAVIAQMEPITVVFGLAEDFLPEVMKPFNAGEKLVVEVRNRDRTMLLATGTLLAVDSTIDLVTLTARFKAVFDNKDHTLFPNQAVNVRLLVDTKKDVVLIPASGVQTSPTTPFVYVVNEAESTVEMRPVTVGPIEGDTASILDKLSPDETVVIGGADKLEPGAKVVLSGAEGGAGREHKKNAEGTPTGARVPEASQERPHKTGVEGAAEPPPPPKAPAEHGQASAAESKPEQGAAPEKPAGQDKQ
jgi:multidrug efflux system membrane fusion protein